MSVMIRVLVVLLLVVLGLTVVFPQWLDFSLQDRSAGPEQSGSIATTQGPAKKVVVEPIKLSGGIDEGVLYVAKVTYYTTSDALDCTKPSFNGRSPLVKTFEFKPLVNNRKHRIEIPLDSLESDSACQWQPRYLETCLLRGNDEPKQHCITLFDSKPNTAMHHSTGRMDLGQEMDGNTIDIECGPFDVYASQTPPCYLPRPYDKDFKVPAIMIENRYALTPGQDVEVNFNFLSVEQAQERDSILKNLLALRVEQNKEEQRQYEQNQRDQEKEIERARAAWERRLKLKGQDSIKD